MSLVDRVEQYPTEALTAFNRVDDALNLVMPGSPTHERYREIESVGLAIVVARDYAAPDSYNPFNAAAPERLSFSANNREKHSDAWAPQDGDSKALGATPPGKSR